ncbi:MAG: nuclear transport factor 2 family protein [Lachnospiraceae bacterium]
MNKDIVLSFVDAINKQDLNLIIALMSDDFVFIDTYGGRENKENMKTGWQGYFEWFPDYCIQVEEYIENDEFSVILGCASGSYLGKPDKHWEFPAAWKVVVSGNQVAVWQVFCDSKKQLDSMA